MDIDFYSHLTSYIQIQAIMADQRLKEHRCTNGGLGVKVRGYNRRVGVESQNQDVEKPLFANYIQDLQLNMMTSAG